MDDVVRIERVIDLPPRIVDDALADPVLVEGWLHPTKLLDDFEGVRVTTAEVPGGTRGSSTRVAVELALVDPRFGAALEQSWQQRLDQLEDLLRGHPVDWRAARADRAAGAPEPDARAN